jgi:hypothetical protein
MSFSRNGAETLLAVGTREGTLAVWEVTRSAAPQLRQPAIGIDDTVLSLAFTAYAELPRQLVIGRTC